jgi:uracil-DNA glycosylase family 4
VTVAKQKKIVVKKKVAVKKTTAPKKSGPKVKIGGKLKKKTAMQANFEAAYGPHRIVEPDPDNPKSGCFFCPLMPFNADFEVYKDQFQRNWEKIQEKEPDGHTIKTRGVCEMPWNKVRVLFVGEAPGADEDKKGLPFVGRSGKFIRTALPEATGLQEHEYAFTNLIRCRPPRNRDPRVTDIRCCSHELAREIEARQPELIVVLGNHSLEFLTGQTGITFFSKKFLKGTHPCWKDKDVLACLHPAYILRMDFKMEEFLDTLARVPEYLSGNYKPLPGAGDYYTLETLDEVKDLAEACLAAPKISFDTETGSLTPFQDEFPPLLCFSFSYEHGSGFTIPFDHADSPWRVGGEKEHERDDLIAIIRDIFESDVPKIAQNEKFDRQHIRKALGGCEIRALKRDTMLTHLCIDERRGTHGLKTLAFAYTGMGGYERPLEVYIQTHKAANLKKGGSYAAIPGKILFPYAGMDSDVTLRCDDGMLEEKEYTDNLKIQRLANSFLPRLSEALADLEYAGARVDVNKVKELDADYTKKMDDQMGAIRKLPHVRAFEIKRAKEKKSGEHRFNPGSTQQLREVLFEGYGLKPIELTDTGFDRMVARFARINKKLKEQNKPLIEFTALCEQAVEKHEWYLFTTKADVLHEYERQGNDLSPMIIKYRELEVVHSTFIAPILGRLDDALCVHGSYLPHGTVTGRLSSREPNLQNIPPEAKCVYISRFGDEGVILQADYSQVELRIAAAWFGDAKMVQAYKKGIDLHTLTAADMHHMSLEQFLALPEKERKPMRTRAKRINFGVLYGGGPMALVTTLRKDGVFITVEEALDFIKQYYAVRPGLKAGIDLQEQRVLAQGYIDSFTGRRRRVPEVFSEDKEIRARALRQSRNHPIQNGASEMTLMSLVLINREMKARGMKSKIVLTVHDSIVFDCHVDEVIEVAALAKQIMENLPSLSDEVLPGLDWKWLNVPIVADLEVGHDWGHMVSFDPFVVAENEAGEDDLFDDKGLARDPVNVDELWDAMAWKVGA